MPGRTTGTEPSLDRAGFPAESACESLVKVFQLEDGIVGGLHSRTSRTFKHCGIRQGLIALFFKEVGPARPGGVGGGQGGKIGVPSSFAFQL